MMTNRNFTNFNEFLNTRYIRRIDSIYMDSSDFDYMVERFKKISEENDKLKAEIDEWKKTVEYHRKKLLEFNNDNADLKAKIEQLKSELEQTTNLMPKICETCKYEDEIGWKEPCNSCKNGNNWKQKGRAENGK